MTDLNEMLQAAFRVEHKEHLDGIRAILIRMEQGGGALGSVDLDELCRRAHTLKAAARVCDFASIEAVGHRLELLFAQMRKGALRPDKAVRDAINLALNAVEDWTLAQAEQRTPPEPTQAIEALERIASNAAVKPKAPPKDELDVKLLAAFQVEHKEHLEGIRAILAEIEQGAAPTAANVDEAFRRAHSLKGAARLAELGAAETLAHRLETLFARVRAGALQLDRHLIQVIHRGMDAIEDWAATLANERSAPESAAVLEAIDQVLQGHTPIESASADDKAPAATAPAMPLFQPVESVRVSADNLDRLLQSTGQLVGETMRHHVVARELTSLGRQINDLANEWETVRGTAAAGLRQLAATPGLTRVARYLNQVEQQVRRLSRQTRAVRLLHQRTTWSLGLLGSQIQNDVRRVRMVSAESVFHGFGKMMRDLARAEGKDIDFRVSGLEIEADRMVLQALKDPLMHILCNAVSHGLELPEDRQRQGKRPIGQVTLRLEAPGNRLQILVEDDGRGIDYSTVAETAVRRGLLTEAQATAASPQELNVQLFKAGFTTSRMVTGLSGRGMGLSVVQETVARLQGTVDLGPAQGQGTAIAIAVPLSVSAQRLLLVSSGGQTFAIAVHGIERLLRVKHQELEYVEGKPMLLLQGQPVPVISLAALLGMKQADVQAEGGYMRLVILRAGAKRLAVAVDALVEERDGWIKDLDEPAVHSTKLAGGILLEDGSVALVLNIAEVIRSFKSSETAASLRRATAAPVKKRSTVLVVDDSLTTRTLEKSILETHGYEVRIAKDGIEAMAQLHSEPVDLVITDIQMPRMDGFQLLEEMKKDQRFSQVPVIVVTSMSSRADQERGLALGANAYVVKRKFDHQELLETIRQMI